MRLQRLFIVFIALAMPVPVLSQPPSGGPRQAVATVARAAEAEAAEAAVPTAAAPAAEAETAGPSREWFGRGGLAWGDWSRMTGDWGSRRTSLEDAGITFSMAHTADASSPMKSASGGSAVGRALTTFGLEFDMEHAGLRGGRVVVEYLHKGGGIGTDCVVDGQGFSNIDADDFGRFGEVWYEQRLGTKARVKIGLNDANSEFAFVDNGGEFINSSMGFSPTIFVLPTYPDSKFGVIVQTEPASWMYAGGGVYNGGPALGVDDFKALFTIGEAGLKWSRLGGGRVGLGYWRTSGKVPGEDGQSATFTTSGQYMVLDQALWTDETGSHPKTVGAFVQAGVADGRVSAISRHIGAGVVATGFVPGRADDAFGVGVTTIRFGDVAMEDAALHGEFNVGAFYKIAMTAWMAVKPDVQVIFHPEGSAARSPIAVATVRFEVAF